MKTLVDDKPEDVTTKVEEPTIEVVKDEPPSKKKDHTTEIVVMIILVIILFGVFMYINFRKKNGDESF